MAIKTGDRAYGKENIVDKLKSFVQSTILIIPDNLIGWLLFVAASFLKVGRDDEMKNYFIDVY